MQNKKRGPSKKPGFRQDLRITPLIEEVFNSIKNKFGLKNNSEALNKIAEFYLKENSLNSFSFILFSNIWVKSMVILFLR